MSATGDRHMAGFTLIEVLVVVTITALIGAVAVPRVETLLSAFALKQEASTLTANLRAARARAIQSDSQITFYLARGGREYGWTSGPTHQMSRDVILAASGPGPFAFYGDGSANMASFSLQSRRRIIHVDVDGATGAVSAGPA